MTTVRAEPAVRVSVLVMTYNHAGFIGQALDSVLAQSTDFPFEILISEDCSTDGTRQIVTDFEAAHPGRTRLLLSERNLRSNEVVARGMRAARGQYTALLDGDDYWTATDKLQRQVDFLDAHPECALCFHNARVVSQDRSIESRNWTPPGQPETSGLEELWLSNVIAAGSVMFRNGLVEAIPDWYGPLFPTTDWPLHLLHAEHGRVGYIDEVMGAYRHHPGGMYSPLSEGTKQEMMRRFYRGMNHNFGYRYDRMVRTGLSTYFFGWAEEYARRGAWSQCAACWTTCLGGRPFNRHIPPTQLLRLGWRILAHRLRA